jgi:hypothetical protein
VRSNLTTKDSGHKGFEYIHRREAEKTSNSDGVVWGGTTRNNGIVMDVGVKEASN